MRLEGKIPYRRHGCRDMPPARTGSTSGPPGIGIELLWPACLDAAGGKGTPMSGHPASIRQSAPWTWTSFVRCREPSQADPLATRTHSPKLESGGGVSRWRTAVRGRVDSCASREPRAIPALGVPLAVDSGSGSENALNDMELEAFPSLSLCASILPRFTLGPAPPELGGNPSFDEKMWWLIRHS